MWEEVRKWVEAQPLVWRIPIRFAFHFFGSYGGLLTWIGILLAIGQSPLAQRLVPKPPFQLSGLTPVAQWLGAVVPVVLLGAGWTVAVVQTTMEETRRRTRVVRRSLQSVRRDAALLQQQYFQLEADRQRERPRTTLMPNQRRFMEEWSKGGDHDRLTEKLLVQQFGSRVVGLGLLLNEAGYGTPDLGERLKGFMWMRSQHNMGELVLMVAGIAETVPDDV
jgi:hypothetical protein